MPYTITLTNGTVLTTVADATVDTTTNLTLLGRNYAGYGGIVAENFVYLLENFADTSAPSSPLTGQLWWNTTTVSMQVWNGTAWVNVGLPATGDPLTLIDSPLIFENPSAPANQRKWRIRVDNDTPTVMETPLSTISISSGTGITVASLTGIAVGQTVSGNGITGGTKVASLVPPDGVVLDTALSGLLSIGDTVTFSQSYVGMLVFEALNDDNTVRNLVMALDGVNSLIKGAVTYSP